MSVYLQEFKSKEDIEAEYDCKLPEDAEILLAWYGYGSYCGSSFVLYRSQGKLWEVNGSHCSCFGLSGQWEPEETTPEALKMRDFYEGYCDGDKEAGEQLKAVVDGLLAAKS